MGTQTGSLLVLGAGHAGSELAVAARHAGWAGPITLVGEEPALPYHRPPLSKAYMCGSSDLDAIALRPEAAYAAARVERLSGLRAVGIDRAGRKVLFDDGREIFYDKLALCLGGRPRPLTCEGLEAGNSAPGNLFYLRTISDADRIRAHLVSGRRMVVIGGGYVGLEVAASAAMRGVQVTVLESQPRVLARVAGPDLSAYYERIHRSHGVEICTSVALTGVDVEGGRIVAVRCADRRLPADVVVAGIGMLPNVELAIEAGIATPLGIEVDEHGCTSDPDILAAGDCTFYTHPFYDREVRIESVPNALEQARAIAGWICAKPRPNVSVPWFWSDQYDLKLQMVGLSNGYEQCVLRGDPSSAGFCAFYLQGSRLLAMDAVNRPADFMLVRRALTSARAVDAKQLADEGIPLKTLLSAVA